MEVVADTLIADLGRPTQDGTTNVTSVPVVPENNIYQSIAPKLDLKLLF